MKIIVSHDVDHLTAREHNHTLLIKFIIRASIELVNKIITFKEYKKRLSSIVANKWQNIEEIIAFEKEENITSTFFIGVANGAGLEYPLDQALFWVEKISKLGVDIGVHGIAFDNKNNILKEYKLMKQKLNKDIGIRMHYLRHDEQTLNHLEKAGYIFDSTVLADKNPYKIGNMWEFPLHIMEGNIFYQNGKRWTSKTLEEYKDITMLRISELEKKEIKYITLLFHDIYFSDSFFVWKEWYKWVINYLKKRGYIFISYKDAIIELNNKILQEDNMNTKDVGRP